MTEKQSTGITKILEALSNNGSPPPLFETDVERMCMEATIKIHEGFKADDLAGEQINEQLSEQINEQIKISRHNQLISVIKNNPGITIPELSSEMRLSQATIRREIDSMRESGLLERKGSRKTGYWQVNDL